MRVNTIRFLIGLAAAIILALILGSCSPRIVATSDSGRVLETFKDNYGKVYLETIPGKADYGAFFQIYFPYQVQKGERIKVVPERYLDSLIQATKKEIM